MEMQPAPTAPIDRWWERDPYAEDSNSSGEHDWTDVTVVCQDGESRFETSLLIRVSAQFRQQLQRAPGLLVLPEARVRDFRIFKFRLWAATEWERLAWGCLPEPPAEFYNCHGPSPPDRQLLMAFCFRYGAASLVSGLAYVENMTSAELGFFWDYLQGPNNVLDAALTEQLLRHMLRRLLQEVPLEEAQKLTPETYLTLWRALLQYESERINNSPACQEKYFALLQAAGHQLPGLWLPAGFSPWPAIQEQVRKLALRALPAEAQPFRLEPEPEAWSFYDTTLLCRDGTCTGEAALLGRVSKLLAEQLRERPYRLRLPEEITGQVQLFLHYLQIYAAEYSLAWGPRRETAAHFFRPEHRQPFFDICRRLQATTMLMPLLWWPASVAEAVMFLPFIHSEQFEPLDDDGGGGNSEILRRLGLYLLRETTAETARHWTRQTYGILWRQMLGEDLLCEVEEDPNLQNRLLDLLSLSGFHPREIIVEGYPGAGIEVKDGYTPAIQARLRQLLA